MKGTFRNIFIKTFSTEALQYVPRHNPVLDSDVDKLKKFIFDVDKILVLTGAGISTESGIPDYRSEEVGLYAKQNHKPIQHQEFMKYPHVRRRYWARNYVGWDAFSKRKPNAIHFSIRNLEHKYNKVTSVITQNVDCLHFKAGSEKVIELHGSAFRVICLKCNAIYNRYAIQEKLNVLNPCMRHKTSMVRPDGDVDIPLSNITGFNPPFCDACGGVLKPDMIFFGDNVPKDRVDAVRKSVTDSDAVLVLGSSLTVYSSYRIILQAKEENKRICIVNIGPTRADDIVDFRIAAKCGDILPKIC